jgi:acetoin utilization deacetylase AcuC-like enzyme
MLSSSKSCGFCIFNSVAAGAWLQVVISFVHRAHFIRTGALHALEAHGTERVAIIDFDIHHGNGTEDIVRKYHQPHRLFFFSIHLYDKVRRIHHVVRLFGA